jgi:hypothetical protein
MKTWQLVGCRPKAADSHVRDGPSEIGQRAVIGRHRFRLGPGWPPDGLSWQVSGHGDAALSSRGPRSAFGRLIRGYDPDEQTADRQGNQKRHQLVDCFHVLTLPTLRRNQGRQVLFGKYSLLKPARPMSRETCQGRSVFRSFNPEPTATALNRRKFAVAVGSGLNEISPRVKN